MFESGLPLTMIGLNLTHQATATREVLERVRAFPGAPARAVEDWMEFFGSRYERVFGRFAPPVHDPCTVALLIDPSNRYTSTLHRDGVTYKGPAFDIDGTIVWGFTAGILDALFDATGWALPWDRTIERPVTV